MKATTQLVPEDQLIIAIEYFCLNFKCKQVRHTLWNFYHAWIYHSAKQASPHEHGDNLLLLEQFDDFFKLLYQRAKHDKSQLRIGVQSFFLNCKFKPTRQTLWKFYFAWVHSEAHIASTHEHSEKLYLMQQVDELLKELHREIRKSSA
jgi:hypothetical protein